MNIPLDFISAHGLAGVPATLILAMLRLEDPTGRDQLAYVTGLAPSTVQRGLKRLQEAGFAVNRSRYFGWSLTPRAFDIFDRPASHRSANPYYPCPPADESQAGAPVGDSAALPADTVSPGESSPSSLAEVSQRSLNNRCVAVPGDGSNRNLSPMPNCSQCNLNGEPVSPERAECGSQPCHPTADAFPGASPDVSPSHLEAAPCVIESSERNLALARAKTGIVVGSPEVYPENNQRGIPLTHTTNYSQPVNANANRVAGPAQATADRRPVELDFIARRAVERLRQTGMPDHTKDHTGSVDAVEHAVRNGWTGAQCFQAVCDWFAYIASPRGRGIQHRGFFTASRLRQLQLPPL